MNFRLSLIKDFFLNAKRERRELVYSSDYYANLKMQTCFLKQALTDIEIKITNEEPNKLELTQERDEILRKLELYNAQLMQKRQLDKIERIERKCRKGMEEKSKE